MWVLSDVPQPPKLDNQLPVSPDGDLADIHVTALLSAIDGLLTTVRLSSPTRVLTPMKVIVKAVSAIVEDICICITFYLPIIPYPVSLVHSDLVTKIHSLKI